MSESHGGGLFWVEVEAIDPEDEVEGLSGYYHWQKARGIGGRSEIRFGYNNLQGFGLVRFQVWGQPLIDQAARGVAAAVEAGFSVAPVWDNVWYNGHIGCVISVPLQSFNSYLGVRRHWSMHNWPDSTGYVVGEVVQRVIVAGVSTIRDQGQSMCFEIFYSGPESVEWDDTVGHTSWGVSVVMSK